MTSGVKITEAANDAFNSIHVLNASVKLGGTLRDPVIDLQSDVGEQVALGVQTAFTNELDKAKERLISSQLLRQRSDRKAQRAFHGNTTRTAGRQ